VEQENIFTAKQAHFLSPTARKAEEAAASSVNLTSQDVFQSLWGPQLSPCLVAQ